MPRKKLLVLYNVDLFTKRLPERFSIVVYLKDNLSQEETQSILATLKRRADIESVKYVSRDAAMVELKQLLKEKSTILEGLEENPLSPSLELRLKRDSFTASSVKTVTDAIKAIPGIDEVYYGEKTADAIDLLKRSMQNLGIIIFLTFFSVIIFVVYSTVKILFYRKKEEIDVLKLLGATGRFIRAPFVIEGGVIGFSGGILGAAGALSAYSAVTYRLSTVIPILKTLIFPMEILGILPLIGFLLGVVGSLIAIGRLRF